MCWRSITAPSVSGASAIDDHTVRIDLREPYFRNTWVLGSTSPLPRYHYDPENLLEGISIPDLERFDELDPEKKERVERFAQRFNEDFHRLPVGAGAFEILEPETDYELGDSKSWVPHVVFTCGAIPAEDKEVIGPDDDIRRIEEM